MEPVVVIPAVKKNVAFPDDLVKKLAGVTLLQRVIDNAARAFSRPQVHVVTDSEEIRLLCQRLGVTAIYDAGLRLDPQDYLAALRPHLAPLAADDDVLLLSPYVPMMGAEELRAAYRKYRESGAELLVPVTRSQAQPFSAAPVGCADIMHDGGSHEVLSASQAFAIFRGVLVDAEAARTVKPIPYEIAERMIEIRSYEDWWLCEKLLNRRRIVFRVIGSSTHGMGHIFRCLALAHEISDHEVRFVCDRESEVAAAKLAGYDYWLGVYDKSEIEQEIVALRPNLVVNDILDTDAAYVRRLRDQGIRVVNFEDLGSGAAEADLTINDIYEAPVIPGERIVWGHNWFFVRDEFADAHPHRFTDDVTTLLVTFGGTDPSDLTRKALHVVAPYCAARGIRIIVVTGEGYAHIDELEAMIAETLQPNIIYTHATGVISHLMEQAQIAVSANGRTVYELAHMNVPAIVISHHEREDSHHFACEENGFLPLGVHQGAATDQRLLESLTRLVEDRDWRHTLFSRLAKAHFTRNKRKVVERILALLPADGQ